MVALGGLMSEQRDNDRTSVPIINQIPLFGDCFEVPARR